MTAEGKILGGRTYRYFEVYISLALIYWVITFILERILILIEDRIKVPVEAPPLIEVAEEEETYDRNKESFKAVQKQCGA